MIGKRRGLLVLSALLLAACGGGGGGGGAPSLVIPTAVQGAVASAGGGGGGGGATTTITGTVAAPAVVSSGGMSANATLHAGLAPNMMPTWFDVISQGMEYTFDPAAALATPATLKVTNLNIRPVDTSVNNQLAITTSVAYPTDAALGQTLYMTNYVNGYGQVYALSTALGATKSMTTLGGLPAVALSGNSLVAPNGFAVAGYALPYSATLNPAGYTYQTFGSWITVNPTTALTSEYYFSFGAPNVTGLPALGTASYTGVAAGSYVDAATRDPADTTATMNATADFGARTVAFSTTATTSLSNNATAGTLASATPGLNMSGTLSYAAGNNTFTGAVTTVNGMSGNATGRFYGPGIGAATGTKVVGAPPEIGGTFAVTGATGAMQGAFGGN